MVDINVTRHYVLLMMLDDYLKAHGISRAEFGRDLGVTGQAVSRWVGMVAIPRPETQLLISEMTDDKIPLKYWAEMARDRRTPNV